MISYCNMLILGITVDQVKDRTKRSYKTCFSKDAEKIKGIARIYLFFIILLLYYVISHQGYLHNYERRKIVI